MEVFQAQELRIAVALTALRHKPTEQAYEAYILDLRASFTLPGPGAAKFDDLAESWRARAVDLEKQLHDLEQKYQGERLELAALRGAPTATTAKKPRKRTKQSSSSSSKAPTDTPIDQDIFTSLLPRINDSGNLFSTLHTLDRLVAAFGSNSSPSETENLFAATTRAVDVLAQTFAGLLPPTPAASSSLGVVAAISTILARLLTVVLPIFTTKAAQTSMKEAPLNYAIEDLLGRLLASILLPALHSFVPLTRQHLSALFDPKTKNRPPTGPSAPTNDLRPPIFALLRTSLASLQQAIAAPSTDGAIGPAAHAVQSSLALEATRELERLCAPYAERPRHVGETAASSPRRPDRGEKLARRDALWYVCGTLRLTLLGTRDDAAGAIAGRLREGVCAALAGVLRGMRDPRSPGRGAGHASGGGLGEVERGMVMAVAETVWLSQG